MPPGAGRKVDFPLLYEKSDPLAAGRSGVLARYQLWVLRSTLNVKATDTTLAPGEGISSDHTLRLRHFKTEGDPCATAIPAQSFGHMW